MIKKLVLFFSGLVVLISSGCSSSTVKSATGIERRQLLLIPADQINQSSAESYEQMKAEAQSKKTLNQNPELTNRVKNIAQKLVPFVKFFREDSAGWAWEANVISSPELNAFCMPGGKIMFYTGIIESLQLTDAEIAAIMGHEIAHALREHGRERMTQAFIEQFGLQALLATGKVDKKYSQELMIASSLAIALPNSRGQESEADELGVELMARAGYDPNAAISLWKKMSQAGGGKPPEILSTHPSDSTRINKIGEIIPKVWPLYLSSKH